MYLLTKRLAPKSNMKDAKLFLAKNGKHLTKEKERKQRWKEYMEELHGPKRPGITHVDVQNSAENR